MANKVLRLIYKVDDQTGGAFSKISMGIIGINQGLEIAKKAAEAAKKAFDFADEGAQLLLTEERFNRLAESIGTTGDVLAEELDIALKGTMSTMEGMALATDFLSLGLVKNQEEAIRLTKVAGDLGMNMNQLVLTLTNQTTMRFDSLGVAVDGFQEKVDKLKEAGYAADEAFRLAFVEQAEDQIAKVGAVADTAAGEFMQLKSAWNNWMDAQKKGAAEVLLPTLVQINDIRDAKEWLREEVDRGAMSQEAANRIIEIAVHGGYDLVDHVNKLIEAKQEENEIWGRNDTVILNAIATAKNYTKTGFLETLQAESDAAENLSTAAGKMSTNATWDAAWQAYLDGHKELAGTLAAEAVAMEALAGQKGEWMDWQRGGKAGNTGSAGAGGGGGRTGGDYRQDKGTGQWYYVSSSGWDPVSGPGMATGGSFTVGGSGGTDSTPVSFMATPGETVSVGGGTSDMENVMAEIRRLVDSIPLAIADAVERR